MCFMAAVSLIIFVYAIRHNKKSSRHPSVNDKTQRKLKCIMAYNSHQEQNVHTITISYPYENQISFLLEHPPQPLNFS